MAKSRRRTRKKKVGKSIRNMWRGLIAVILMAGCGYLASHLSGQETNEQVLSAHSGDYGNLLEVKTRPGTPSVLKSYRGMDLSFNPQCHIPNWVSWELTAEETSGSASRTNKFASDPDVEGCADTWDYSYSGYDRGHMAPAGDMKWSAEAMAETFLLTNICPQAKSLNAGSWKGLEEKCRQWAEADSAIYIVCGPVIDGNPTEYIGDSRVYVPRKFFKAIISPYSVPARGIGFIMPNEKVKGGMQACAVTIDSIEALTGHDFFSSLPDEIEKEVESQCNFHYWSTHRKR